LTVGRNTLLAIAALYAIVVAMITIVPLRATTDSETHVNVVPFASVAACLSGKSHDVRHIPRRCIGNILGNVLLFVPFGLLFTAITRRYRSAGVLLLAAALTSASIEALQYAERNVPIGRTVDVDDVLWNTLGALAGFLLLRLVRDRVLAPRDRR
jgi:glycopeptide antibiotics resistance protein